MTVKKTKDKYGQTVWTYDVRINSKRHRKSGFGSEQSALVALSKLRIREVERESGVTVAAPNKVTVAEILKAHLKRLPVPPGSRGYTSRLQAARDIKRFLSTLESLGLTGLLATELKTAHLTAYQDARIAGRAYETVFREITNILTPLNNAWERYPSLENWRPPKRPTADRPKGAKKGRKAIYRPDDIGRLISYLRRPMIEKEHPLIYRGRISAADALQLALAVAGRAGEIRTRRWSDVHWDTNKIRIDDYKQNEEDLTILPPEAIEMLRRRKAEQVPASEFIFPSSKRTGKPILQINVGIIRKAAKHLGIEWGYDSPNGVVFHSARHTATTAMLSSGIDMATVQSQTRHSDRTMVQRYGQASDPSRRIAAAAVARVAFPDLSVSESKSPELDTHNTDNGKTGKQKVTRNKGKNARNKGLERATGLEPATLSLGTRCKVKRKKQLQLQSAKKKLSTLASTSHRKSR